MRIHCGRYPVREMNGMDSWQTFAAVAGRAMDGWALYDHLTAAPTNHAHDLVSLNNPGNAAAVETVRSAAPSGFAAPGRFPAST